MVESDEMWTLSVFRRDDESFVMLADLSAADDVFLRRLAGAATDVDVAGEHEILGESLRELACRVRLPEPLSAFRYFLGVSADDPKDDELLQIP
jgi:hypothetical protein